MSVARLHSRADVYASVPAVLLWNYVQKIVHGLWYACFKKYRNGE